MKKILFLLILFYIAFTDSLVSQSVHFPQQHAVWHETYLLEIPPPYIFDYTDIGVTYYNGDTVINGLFYHKLNNEIRSIWCSAVVLSSGYRGAIREDTLAGKVYLVKPGNSTEEILYDFTLQPGELVPPFGPCVVSIDTVITVDGILRRRWNTSELPGLFAVIEGIGSTNGLISNTLNIEYPNHTLCFEGDNFQTISVSLYNNNCHVESDTCYTGMTEAIPEKILVYPNPAKAGDKLEITSRAVRLQSIRLLNETGNLVFSAGLSGYHAEFSAPACEGMYFIVIEAGLQSFTTKLIVLDTR
jgi:hypothetical protein